MDTIFKRYACPFTLMDGYIRTARLCEFIETIAKQKQEDDRWEFYLHRVWDKSYPDFCESLRVSQDLRAMSDDEIGATVQESMNILGKFNPDLKEGEE